MRMYTQLSGLFVLIKPPGFIIQPHPNDSTNPNHLPKAPTSQHHSQIKVPSPLSLMMEIKQHRNCMPHLPSLKSFLKALPLNETLLNGKVFPLVLNDGSRSYFHLNPTY